MDLSIPLTISDRVIQFSEILDFRFPRISVGASCAREVLAKTPKKPTIE